MALLFHDAGQRLIGRAVHVVHGVVHGEHGARQLGIRIDKRLQALAHHLGGHRRHARNVDRQFGGGHLVHAAHALADGIGRIAHQFQIRVDLDDAQDEAQIAGHGLLHRQQVQRRLVDLPLQPVDGDLRTAHQIADRQIVHPIRLGGALDALLGEAGHHQQPLLQVVKALVEAYARHPNLPVI